MSTSTPINARNVLGQIRAEADRRMLEKAFFYTAPFESLTSNTDFSLVIGRRGTGKSALFIKSSEKLSEDKKNIVITEFPDENDVLAFRASLGNCGCTTYTEGRSISALVWQIFIAGKLIEKLLSHYKSENTEGVDFLQRWKDQHFIVMKRASLHFIFLNAIKKESGLKVGEIPNQLATHYEVKELMASIEAVIRKLHFKSFIMFDGLDEGWSPDHLSTSILGGLLYVSSKFKDKNLPIHIISFVRDNIFRAVSSFDPDSSRNVEGEALRLVWTEESLLALTLNRIRESLNLHTENDTKVWDRLFAKELKGREGFKKIVNYTLFRPRDVLVLVNTAFNIAAQAGRDKIIEADIDATAMQISQERYRDLLKEYEVVLPGLEEFCEIFRGEKAKFDYSEVIQLIKDKQDTFYSGITKTGDFGLFGQPDEIFLSLYSVGFFGKLEPKTSSYLFCHDGSQTSIKDFKSSDQIMIHPCYWRAMGTKHDLDESEVNVIPAINDEYGEIKNADAIQETRHRLIGKIHSDLSQIPLGDAGASAFEKWVFTTLKLLTHDDIHDMELHGNKNAIHRRDIIGTIIAERGFWKRVLDDYKSRQIVFEVKNFKDLSIEHFRQVSSYLSRQYGTLAFIVKRDDSENLSKPEIGWTNEIYHEHKKLIIVLSDSFLKRSLSKLRGEKRESYFESKLKKKLDDYERKVLSHKH